MIPGAAGSPRLRSTLLVVVGALVVLLLGTVAAGGWSRLVVSQAEQDLRQRVLPARQASSDLATAFVDQEAGQRGYLLTGDRQLLQPYVTGRADAARLIRDLRRRLPADAAARRALTAVGAAAADWQNLAAEPEIAARDRGPVPPDQLVAMGRNGTARFDALRVRLAALEARTATLAHAELARIARAGRVADGVAIIAVALAVLVSAVAAVLLRTRLTRPLDRLVGQVRAVAAGAQHSAITPSGPAELAVIAEAVQQMRTSIVAHQRELTLRVEHDRLATELHDLTMQRMFGLGLGLSSLARRHPDVAPAVAPMIAETDRIISEIRSVVFDLGRAEAPEGLRGRITDLAEDSARAFGFTPTLEFAGPVDAAVPEDVANALLAGLREELSRLAHDVSPDDVVIRTAALDGAIVLRVAHDGVAGGRDHAGLPPAHPLGDRVAPYGGTLTLVRPPEGGTVVEWRVPLR